MPDLADRAAERIAHLAINSTVADEDGNARTVREVAAEIIREEIHAAKAEGSDDDH